MLDYLRDFIFVCAHAVGEYSRSGHRNGAFYDDTSRLVGGKYVESPSIALNVLDSRESLDSAIRLTTIQSSTDYAANTGVVP